MKTIINFCPTGMIPTKSMTPHVPLSVSEIVEQVHEAYEIGITMAHIHARDDDGNPTWLMSTYQSIFDKLRLLCPELILCASTSGRSWGEYEKRAEVIDIKPDMCSLTLTSLNFPKQASVNSPNMIKRLIARMDEMGVIPELEAFDFGAINYGKYLIRKGIIKEPTYWNLLFGNIAGFQLRHVISALSEIPDNHLASCAGLGGTQLGANAISIVMGRGVRVGIEDNIYYDSGRKILCTNIMLIKRIHEIMKIHERELMTSAECSKTLNIKNGSN